jgi:hypothetical protein
MKYSTEVKSEALRLRTEGRLSYGDIAKRLGVTKSICHVWLKHLPIPENKVTVLDKTGIRYGRLLVKGIQGTIETGSSRRKQYAWLCVCDCGTEAVIRGHQLTTGRTKSCGCLQRDSSAKTNYKHGKTRTVEYVLLMAAKTRAKAAGLAFNISLEDIIIPERCPLLGVKLNVGGNHRFTPPSLDRVDPSKGYVQGNIWVVSTRANTIKNDATLEELEMITKALGHRISAIRVE